MNNNLSEIDRKSAMRGTVMSTADPSLEGRIAVLIPKLMLKNDPNKIGKLNEKQSLTTEIFKNKEIADLCNNNVETSNTVWARPKFNNSFMVPYVGQTVEVFFEDGDPNKIYYNPLEISLEGQVIEMDMVKSTEDRFSVEKKPFIHVFKEFKDATIMYFNENQANKRFEITFKSKHSISINENLKEDCIEIVTKDSHRVILDTKNKHVTVHTSKGHKIFMDDAGKQIKITTTGGHIIHMDDNAKSITAKASSGGKMVLGQGNVRLNP